MTANEEAKRLLTTVEFDGIGEFGDRELYYTINGITEGEYKRWYNNGQLQKDGNYKNGKLSGVWKRWHPNGKLWSTGIFKNGYSVGEYKEWDYDGTFFKKEEYFEGE